MNWTAVAIAIGVTGFALTVIIPILQSKDKINIRIDGLTYRILPPRGELKMGLTGELERLGARDSRYLDKIIIKPANAQGYCELARYFILPTGGVIPFAGPLTVAKNQRIQLNELAGISLKPLPAASSESRKGAAEEMIKEMEQASYTIGIAWCDTTKVQWLTITKEDYGKWIAF
ncbi:MAG: hypothetical protein ABIB93_01695 [Chloroflexota bacterium]